MGNRLGTFQPSSELSFNFGIASRPRPLPFHGFGFQLPEKLIPYRQKKI